MLNTVRSSHGFWWDSHPDLFDVWRKNITKGTAESALPMDPITSRDALMTTTESFFTGVTTNPALIRAAIAHGMSTVPRGNEFWVAYHDAVQRAAYKGMNLWQRSRGAQGWVCGQVDPNLDGDAEAMVEHGLELADLSPNVMVKVPGSAAGYTAMRSLVAASVSINATANFSVAQAAAFCASVRLGTAERDPRRAPVKNVFTLMLGRTGASADVAEVVRDLQIGGAPTVRWIEVAVSWAVDKVLRDSGLPVQLLFSSIKFDWDAPTPAMHLTHTPPESLVTINPDVATSIVRGTILRQPSTLR